MGTDGASVYTPRCRPCPYRCFLSSSSSWSYTPCSNRNGRRGTQHPIQPASRVSCSCSFSSWGRLQQPPPSCGSVEAFRPDLTCRSDLVLLHLLVLVLLSRFTSSSFFFFFLFLFFFSHPVRNGAIRRGGVVWYQRSWW